MLLPLIINFVCVKESAKKCDFVLCGNLYSVAFVYRYEDESNIGDDDDGNHFPSKSN